MYSASSSSKDRQASGELLSNLQTATASVYVRPVLATMSRKLRWYLRFEAPRRMIREVPLGNGPKSDGHQGRRQRHSGSAAAKAV